MKFFNTLALISVCVAWSVGATANATKTANSAPASQSQTQARQNVAVQSGTIYDRYGKPVTAMQVGKARAAEAAVKKAGVASDSSEAAMIRIGMGQAPETAYQSYDGIYDAEGNRISSRQAAEDLAVEEVVRRSGAEPGSDREAMIRAAASGDVETDVGDQVDSPTIKEVAKEVAVQQAILRTGVEPGSSNESLIRMGADVIMDRFKSWK